MSGCQACLNFKMIEVSTHTTSQTTLPTSCASGKLQFLCFIPSEVHQTWFNSRKRNAFHTKNPLKKISSRWRSIKDLNPRSLQTWKNPSHRVLELGVARGSAFWWAMDRMILSIFTGGSVFNVGMAQIEKLWRKTVWEWRNTIITGLVPGLFRNYIYIIVCIPCFDIT